MSPPMAHHPMAPARGTSSAARRAPQASLPTRTRMRARARSRRVSSRMRAGSLPCAAADQNEDRARCHRVVAGACQRVSQCGSDDAAVSTLPCIFGRCRAAVLPSRYCIRSKEQVCECSHTRGNYVLAHQLAVKYIGRVYRWLLRYT